MGASLNLNHWADGAWADGSWVPASWGIEGAEEAAVEQAERPAGGYTTYTGRRRGRHEIDEARARFGLSETVEVIPTVIPPLPAPRQERELGRDTVLRGLELDIGRFEELRRQSERLLAQEIAAGVKAKQAKQREEEALTMILGMVV